MLHPWGLCRGDWGWRKWVLATGQRASLHVVFEHLGPSWWPEGTMDFPLDCGFVPGTVKGSLGCSWPRVLWVLWSTGTQSQLTPPPPSWKVPSAQIVLISSPHKKRLVKAGVLALITHTTRACAGSGLVKGDGIFFSSLYPSSFVYANK